MLYLILAATATVLATGLGAIPVWLLGERANHWRPLLGAIAGGVMLSASIFGLIEPAIDAGGYLDTFIGLCFGVAFLFVARTWV
ncbi:MAG: hypothetical protein WBP55_03490, partial [Solirubrobacterales bacterium]